MSASYRGAARSLGEHAGTLVEGACGIGRLLEAEGRRALVEYFDRPGENGLERRIEDAQDLRRAVLDPQTRVHWREDEVWHHGRVIEHDRADGVVVVRGTGRSERIIAEAAIVVRWRQRLRDASALLADGWVESRRYHDARASFVRAYLRRATDYRGLTAISSSAIETHAHQVEAVRRVLTDVEPRYLLADEVGLGKTIEAGLLVRQFLLDREDARAVVVVPPALTYQWRDELDTKFAISEQFPERCSVVSHDDFQPSDVVGATMLVVDEAHRLTRRHDDGYRRLRDAALDVPGILLLSATPLLQESASLLRMLHLLSPEVHPLEDEATFAHALASREEMAAFYGNLSETAQPVFLASAVAGLRAAHTDDALLAMLLDEVDVAIARGDSGALVKAVRDARSHVSEVHRLHNRMIRTRRGVGLAEDFPVLGRVQPKAEKVPDALGAVSAAFAAWQDYVLARADGADAATTRRLVSDALPILAAVSTGGSALPDAIERSLSRDADLADEERELLSDLADAGRQRAAACPRIAAAVACAVRSLADGQRVAIAASTEDLAATVTEALQDTVTAPVFRIARERPEAGRLFAETAGASVVVFGPVGEEGQNLQYATLVVHVDLPWDANRIEQRLGRFDRFGPGVPCDHIVLIDDVDSPANAWHDLLRDGFGVYSGSIASLQVAIERLASGIDEAAVLGGPTAVRALAPAIASDLEQELSAIELMELLDETVLDARGQDFVDAVDLADRLEPTTTWEEAVVLWASGGPDGTADLRFHHSAENGRHAFALTRYERPDVARLRDTDLPLVAWRDLLERFSGSMPDTRAEGTFRRTVSANRGLRLFGPGDPFVDALWDFTEVDDRGRSYALWRARSSWPHDEALFACFDLRIRPDIEAAVAASGQDPALVEAALRRRAEGHLPALTERVWLGVNGRAVVHEGLLRFLEAPYAERRGDRTLRPRMWDRLDVHVSRASWAEWCASQAQRAIEVVTQRQELADRCRRAADQAAEDGSDQVARIVARGGATARDAADFQAGIVAALVAGLERPRFEIDAAGIVVVASEPLAQEPDE